MVAWLFPRQLKTDRSNSLIRPPQSYEGARYVIAAINNDLDARHVKDKNAAWWECAKRAAASMQSTTHYNHAHFLILFWMRLMSKQCSIPVQLTTSTQHLFLYTALDCFVQSHLCEPTLPQRYSYLGSTKWIECATWTIAWIERKTNERITCFFLHQAAIIHSIVFRSHHRNCSFTQIPLHNHFYGWLFGRSGNKLGCTAEVIRAANCETVLMHWMTIMTYFSFSNVSTPLSQYNVIGQPIVSSESPLKSANNCAQMSFAKWETPSMPRPLRERASADFVYSKEFRNYRKVSLGFSTT